MSPSKAPYMVKTGESESKYQDKKSSFMEFQRICNHVKLHS